HAKATQPDGAGCEARGQPKQIEADQENDSYPEHAPPEEADRLVKHELDRNQSAQDHQENPVKPFAVLPALDRVPDQEPVGHRARRTVPVRSIKYSAPSK